MPWPWPAVKRDQAPTGQPRQFPLGLFGSDLEPFLDHSASQFDALADLAENPALATCQGAITIWRRDIGFPGRGRCGDMSLRKPCVWFPIVFFQRQPCR